MINTWSRTLVGKKEENEDVVYIDEKLGIFIIADGMSGCNGKYAASSSVRFVAELITDQLRFPVPEADGHKFLKYLAAIVERANEKLVIHSRAGAGNKRCGTTIDVMVLKDNTFYYAHVGDSTIYVQLKDFNVVKLSKDQTAVQEKVDAALLTLEEARVQPDYYQLVSFLGDEEFKGENIITGSIAVPRKIIMVTDGLTDVTAPQELEQLISSYHGAQLVDEAVKLYQAPSQICDLYMAHNPGFVYDLIMEMEDESYAQLQSRLAAVGSKKTANEIISDSLQKEEHLKEQLRQTIRHELSLRDNFTIVYIEPGKRKSLPRRIYECYRKIFRPGHRR